jgi:hypothetical protein
MNIRLQAEDATWTLREAAWGLEERLLWRGRDAAHQAAESAAFKGHRVFRRIGRRLRGVAARVGRPARALIARAGRATEPVQRTVQTRLSWPLADALGQAGWPARAAVAISAAGVALAAAAAGALIAPKPVPAPHDVPPPQASALAAIAPASAPAANLEGAAPRFVPGDAPAPPPAEPADVPSVPPAQVAYRFAAAFVGYEVGKSTKQTAQAFAETASPALATTLASDPPRLPVGTKVPRARVLNVVLNPPTEGRPAEGKRAATKDEVTASVSLVRLRAISEIRLTLTKTEDVWRVTQVLG